MAEPVRQRIVSIVRPPGKRLDRILREFETYRAIQRHIKSEGGDSGPLDLPLWFRFKSRVRKILCIVVRGERPCWWGKPHPDDWHGSDRVVSCRLCGATWANFESIRERLGLPYEASVREVERTQVLWWEESRV